MFLAPLNYDKYFNKVFSSERVSKRFLEDFLEADINEFEMLKGRHRITDDAALVEFDFRCKIEDSFVILDMQQWYRRDTNPRFYLYHALNTGLQLEELPDKRVLYDYSYQKTKKVKEIGEKRGKKIKAVEIATGLKAKGFDDKVIAEVTGLTLEEIARI